MQELLVQLSNVHCEDCEDTIIAVLSRFFELQRGPEDVPQNESSVFFKLSHQKTVVLADQYDRIKGSVKKIVKALAANGFDVLSWELFVDKTLDINSETSEVHHASRLPIELDKDFFDIFGFFSKRSERKLIANHLKHCRKCRFDAETTSSSDEDVKFVVDKPFQEYRAVFSVSGMSCASCVQTVSSTISSVMEANEMGSADEKDPSYSVNLLQHSAIAIVTNKQIVNKLVDAINETGFECQLLELLPVQRSTNTRVNAIIGGITCAACVNTIENAVKDLPFVLESGVNVVTKSAQFVLEDDDNSNIEKLKNRVEECGYDFELTSKSAI